MDKINRSVVKNQAKQINKGKVFSLFLICIVVIILTGGVETVSTRIEDFVTEKQNDSLYDYSYGEQDDYSDWNSYFEQFFGDEYGDYYGNNDYYSYDDDEDYYGYSEEYDSDNPIDQFGSSSGDESSSDYDANVFSSFGTDDSSEYSSSYLSVLSVVASLLALFSLIMSPLMVSLNGFFVDFVKRNPDEELSVTKSLRQIFKKTFSKKYFNKLVLNLVLPLIICLLCCLLIVPGIIYYYGTYFASQIMMENETMKPSEAVKLSRKMVKGHRGELFVLDLSYIGWLLLTAITCGIVGIYAIPYYMTTKALFYQNFRARGIAHGQIFETDFVSDYDRKNANANNFGGYGYNNSGEYYQPNQYAQNNQGNQNQNYNYYYNAPQDTYQTPNDSEQTFTSSEPTEPVEPDFIEPTQQETQPQEPQDPYDSFVDKYYDNDNDSDN